MIEIIYYRDEYRVTAKGHAGYDEIGRDIICAAVSMLVCTIARNMQSMLIAGHGTVKKIRLQTGNAEVQISPNAGYEEEARTIFDAICLGFDELAFQEKKFVKYEVRG